MGFSSFLLSRAMESLAFSEDMSRVLTSSSKPDNNNNTKLAKEVIDTSLIVKNKEVEIGFYMKNLDGTQHQSYCLHEYYQKYMGFETRHIDQQYGKNKYQFQCHHWRDKKKDVDG